MEYNLNITSDNQFNVGLTKSTEYNVELEKPSFSITSITAVVKAEWGQITGDFSEQEDLKNTLNEIDRRLDILESRSSDVLTYESYLVFPNIGLENTLYLDEESNQSYRWDSENTKYYKINDLEEIIEINGGTANGK